MADLDYPTEASKMQESGGSVLLYQKESDRLHALDALRGLAAMIVVLMHFHDLLFGKERRAHLSHMKLLLLYLASPFRSGASAVALFFVLSGFVLALPLLRRKRGSYLTYAIRRILRIYVPYLAALALAVWGAAHFHGQLPRGMWGFSPWPAPPALEDVWQHVLFLGTYNVLLFNFVFWTLVIELRVSLAYPFIVRAFAWLPFRIALILNASTLVLLSLLALRYPQSDGLKTLRFGCFFVVGLFLAQKRDIVKSWYLRQPSAFRTALPLVALLAFGYTIALRAPAPVSDLICLLSSVGIIVAALFQPGWKHMLEARIPQFLGQISYSLYLTHLPVLFIGYVLIGRYLSTFAFLALYLTSAVSFSALFYVLVERSCLLLSRHYVQSQPGSLRLHVTQATELLP